MSRQIADEINRAMRSTDARTTDPDHTQVEVLAYQLWCERGCPNGSDQDDWFRAEEHLRNANKSVRRVA